MDTRCEMRRWRSQAWSVVLCGLLLWACAGPSQAQSADVAMTLQVSKITDLRIGDVISVSATVRNHGPDTASKVSIAAGQASLEVFLYNLLGSSTPECGAIEQLDIDPPAYSFFWTVPSIPAGGAVICTAQLEVIRVPGDRTSVMYAGADPPPFSHDPNESNNRAAVALTFAPPLRAPTIPSDSWWAFALVVAGVLLGAFAQESFEVPSPRHWGEVCSSLPRRARRSAGVVGDSLRANGPFDLSEYRASFWSGGMRQPALTVPQAPSWPSTNFRLPGSD